MSSLKPIVLHGHEGGKTPNPPKVAVLLEFLKLPYTVVKHTMGNPADALDVKNESYLKLNPNGRVPAIVDPNNNDFVVWESAAVLYYLAEKYDSEGKFFGKTLEEKTEVMIWLTHQVSGLGPSQGQANWFLYFHKKQWGVDAPQDVIDRYKNETQRLWNVLEVQLQKQKERGSSWLVLDRITIADISFYAWLNIAGATGMDFAKQPLVEAYVQRIRDLEECKKAYSTLSS